MGEGGGSWLQVEETGYPQSYHRYNIKRAGRNNIYGFILLYTIIYILVSWLVLLPFRLSRVERCQWQMPEFKRVGGGGVLPCGR